MVGVSSAHAQSGASRTNIDPREIFLGMNQAVDQYDYDALMVYEQGGSLSTFAVSNVAAEGTPRQTLERLNDLPAKAALNNRCLDLQQNPPADYSYYLRGITRVAGRTASEIYLVPNDNSRYARSFAVDRETGLMLRESIIQLPENLLIERYELLSLEASERLSEPEPEDSSSGAAQDELDSGLAQPTAEQLAALREQACSEMQMPPTGWYFRWLPPGFSRVAAESAAIGERLVFSDGLSTIVIKIVPVSERAFPLQAVRAGAVNMYVGYLQSEGGTYEVTLAGDVPLLALDYLAGNMVRER